MIHRHLIPEVGYQPVAIEGILDRGRPDDWDALLDAVLADPHGEIAQSVLQLCAATHMYGTSNLWRNLILFVRRQNAGA